MMENQDYSYIRKAYGVPAAWGARVTYAGGDEPRGGRVTGVQGTHILILLDGDSQPMPYHPTWKIKYHPEDKQDVGPLFRVLKQFRESGNSEGLVCRLLTYITDNGLGVESRDLLTEVAIQEMLDPGGDHQPLCDCDARFDDNWMNTGTGLHDDDCAYLLWRGEVGLV